MITFTRSSFTNWHAGKNADQPGDIGLGNMMFFIAGVIGIATKNGYDYGFFPWKDQRFFANSLPLCEIEYPQYDIPWGFHGFDVPDNVSVYGYMQSFKYIEHCEDLIRHYFTFSGNYEKPDENTVVVHYRNYTAPFMYKLLGDYYSKALGYFEGKKVVVITDDVEVAKDVIKRNFEYRSRSPIEDFYYMAHAKHAVISNSTYSAWTSWLSKARTVAPRKWMAESEAQVQEDIYMKDWIVI